MNKLIRLRLNAGFSLIEILFAIFILGIGLLMVAAVFPIAIKWTNQDVHSTIGLVISRSAVAQLKATGLAGTTAVTASGLSGLSATVPQPYRYGTPNPTPSVGIVQPTYAYTTNDLNARYWWQAVLVPATPTTAMTNVAPTVNAISPVYHLYIFVFSKGNISNTYPAQFLINNSNSNVLAPSLQETSYSGAAANTSMPVGAIGLDLATGAVVRKEIINPQGGGVPYLGLSEEVESSNVNDPILFAPPANGQQKSPLIYIYATTVTF